MSAAVPEAVSLTPEDVLDADAFRRLVAEPCRPVVLRGLCRRWPAAQAGAESPNVLVRYLAGFDAGGEAEAFVGDPAIGGRYHYGEAGDGFNFGRQTMRFADALTQIVATSTVAGSPSIYMGSLPIDSYLPGFAEANFLAVLPAVRPRIWVGHASVVACHHDNYDNLACVVAGRRRFTLFPPDAIGDLYVGPIDQTLAGQPISLAVGTAKDDPRYPRFAGARDRALVVELEPGDALYIPKLWWHQVEATSPFNMLVNYWWDAFPVGPDSPYIAMLLAAAAIAERPEPERAAWRAYFDHYVFRPDGHPLAHLPVERHGLLGAGQQGRLRANVMRLLRGG